MGTSIIIKKSSIFAKEVLPIYFYHEDFSLFSKQLKENGFHIIEQSNNSLCFSHPKLCREDFNLFKSAKEVPKQLNNTENNNFLQEKIQETINIFASRLSHLEEKCKDSDWLKSECERLEYLQFI